MFLGATSLANFRIGATQVSKIYLGATQVWSSLDPDAAAYINVVAIAKGSSVTSTRQTAINNFVVAEKLAGRWTKHKGIYLPIWGNAAANAIDMVSLTSGTFFGTVTHGAGYIQGDGATGYFNTGRIASVLGLDNFSNGGSCSALVYVADTRNISSEWMGSSDGSNRRLIVGQVLNNFVSGICYSASAGVSFTDNLKKGIYVTSIDSITSRRIFRYTNGNILERSATRTDSNTFTAPTVSQYIMGRNGNGTMINPTDAQIGFSHFGFGMTPSEIAEFTNNIETLWETCTGLTLP